MKLFYVANNRIPDERAYGIHIVKMCEALAEKGADLTLLLPRRWDSLGSDIFSHYRVKSNFKIKKLPVFDLVFLKVPFVFFFIETITFCLALFFYFLFQKEKAAVYTRGEMVLFLARFLPKRFSLFWETHIKPRNFERYKYVLKKVSGLVVVNKYYRDELINDYGLPEEKVFLFPDGVDLEQFDITVLKDEARKKLGLPFNKKIVLYVGSDLDWKGLDVLKKAADFLQDDCLVVFVGRIEGDDCQNAFFAGRQPNYEIPFWLKAADVLILTGTSKSEVSSFYTSPLKMFEYMASKRPIIAADLASFREILNEGNAFFYDSESPRDLSENIKFVLENYNMAEEKASAAFEEVKKYSWKIRAEKIIGFIENYAV